ncbi:transposase [Vibrio nereis]|uniref:Transposase n=1 Tax=Vibrio nereis TaxID=693 RepID=A0A0M0HLL0_VIBNE|nr:transposase [Vibrio nereis]
MLDGAAYHRTELVITAAKVLNIEFHYLPLYSPNLNPIERLRKVMNEHVQNNVYFSSKIKFISAIKAFFDSTLPEITDSLMPRTTGSFQLLKPASSS